MNTEYEATFTDINREEMVEKLQGLSATLVRSDFLQKRYCFNTPDCCDLPNSWVRVRDEDEKITVALKSMPEGTGEIDKQKEIEFTVDSFDEARSFFQNLGLEEVSYQETRREKWLLDGVEVYIDEWPHLEPFIEVEGLSEEVVKNVAEKLGFDWSQAIFNSVDELYHRKYGVDKDIINNKTPRITFDEANPFL